MEHLQALSNDGRPSATFGEMNRCKNTDPLITIICPIYNDADLVSETINSVLRQTLRNFKFIIFDNGSSDHTRKVISSYNDDRITIVSSHLNIKSEVMASLMLEVNTPYLAQIYSDDVWEPKKLAISIAELDRSGGDVVFSNNSFIGDDGRYLRDEEVPRSQFVGDISSMTIDEHLYKFIFRGNTLHPVSMVIKTDSYKRIGGVKPYLHSIGDMEFFARLLLNTKVSFIEDKLQRIRIKSVGRQNESAPSRSSYLRVLGERMRFLDLLLSPQFLSRMNSVFFPEIKKAVIDPAMKKWFLGHQIIKLGDPDCAFYGMQLLYSALDDNFEQIERYVVAAHGTSLGQYIEDVGSKIFLPAITIFAGLDENSVLEFARLNNIIAAQELELRKTNTSGHKSDYFETTDRFKRLEAAHHQTVVELDAQKTENKRIRTSVEGIFVDEIVQLKKEIAALRKSTSWRITAPLRHIVTIIRGKPRSRA